MFIPVFADQGAASVWPRIITWFGVSAIGLAISLNSFASGATTETARLSGRVTLLNPDGTTAAAYDVTATSRDVVDLLPAGTNIVTVSPTSQEYYQAIVQAFARGAAVALSGEA